MALGNEKTYVYKNMKIRYTFKKSTYSNSSNLVISFSGFNTNADGKPTYGYMRTLEGVDINQLFILDEYGGKGCYYLGQMPEFLVEEATTALIEFIITENKISKENVICMGSSKGGWAAIYYAIKLELAYAIVAEPQIYIADYLSWANKDDVLNYMLGYDLQKYDILNTKLIDLALSCNKLPKISIQLGENGYHHKKHIEPFKIYLDLFKDKTKCNLYLENYTDHLELGKHYPDFIFKKILDLFPSINSHLYIKNIIIRQDSNRFYCYTQHNRGVKFAWYVYLDGEHIFTRWYEDNEEFIYIADKLGKYSFRAFLLDNENNKISKGTTSFLVSELVYME